MKSCHRSTSQIIARGNYRTLARCQQYALDRGGLSFNFSPSEANLTSRNSTEDNFNSCQIFGCAEGINSSRLVNDSRYDYYSLYGNAEALADSTCISTVGIFHLHLTPENFTSSTNKCHEFDGSLAHVANEKRTNGLAALVSTNIKQFSKIAFIGLQDDRSNRGHFTTSQGTALDCYTYRAWAPGHPLIKAKGNSCVAIDSDRMWKVVNCKLKLPFICEVFNLPPILRRATNCSEIANKDERKKCRKRRKKHKPRSKHRHDRCKEA